MKCFNADVIPCMFFSCYFQKRTDTRERASKGMLTYPCDLLPQIVCPMDDHAIPSNSFCSAPPHSEPPPPLLPLSSITPRYSCLSTFFFCCVSIFPSLLCDTFFHSFGFTDYILWKLLLLFVTFSFPSVLILGTCIFHLLHCHASFKRWCFSLFGDRVLTEFCWQFNGFDISSFSLMVCLFLLNKEWCAERSASSYSFWCDFFDG